MRSPYMPDGSVDWLRAACVLCIALSRAAPTQMSGDAGLRALQCCRALALQLISLLLRSLWSQSTKPALCHVAVLCGLSGVTVLLNSVVNGLVVTPATLEQAWYPLLLCGALLASLPLRGLLVSGWGHECIGGPPLQCLLTLGFLAFVSDTARIQLDFRTNLPLKFAGAPNVGLWPLFLHFAGAQLLTFAVVSAGHRRIAGLVLCVYAETAAVLGDASAATHGPAAARTEALALALPAPHLARCAVLAELFWVGAFCSLSPCIFREVVAETQPRRRARWPMAILVAYLFGVMIVLAVWPERVIQPIRWFLVSVLSSCLFISLVCPAACEPKSDDLQSPQRCEGLVQAPWLRHWTWCVLVSHVAVRQACTGRPDMVAFLGGYIYVLALLLSAVPFLVAHAGSVARAKAAPPPTSLAAALRAVEQEHGKDANTADYGASA